jgi:hypothetical protein
VRRVAVVARSETAAALTAGHSSHHNLNAGGLRAAPRASLGLVRGRDVRASVGRRLLWWCAVVAVAALAAMAQRVFADHPAPRPDAADGMVVRIGLGGPLALADVEQLGGGGGGGTWLRLIESGGPFVIVWAILVGTAHTFYRMIYRPERAADRELKEKELDVKTKMTDAVESSVDAAKAISSASASASASAATAAASAATAAADARVASENGLKVVQLLERRLEREAARGMGGGGGGGGGVVGA